MAELLSDLAGPFDRLDAARLNPALEANAFCEWRGGVGARYCAATREEIEMLFEAEMMQPSRNRLATRRDALGRVTAAHTLRKPGVFELDIVVDGKVTSPAALSLCPSIAEFHEVHGPELARRLSSACPALRLTGVDTIKAQINEGVGGESLPRSKNVAPP